MIQCLRFLAVVCRCSSFTSNAQQKPAKTLDGTVADQQGRPIAGAKLWHQYAFDVSQSKSRQVVLSFQ